MINFKNKKLGILGGGQLGKMIASTASRLGIKTFVYDPNKISPAFQNANKAYIAKFDNKKSLKKFAQDVDFITYEFENIPLDSLRYLNKYRKIFPGINALKYSQDRYYEKKFIKKLGIEVAPFCKVAKENDISLFMKKIGGNCILKTRKLGYDGKGQHVFRNYKINLDKKNIKENQFILEGFIKFKKEISVIVIRTREGKVICYEPSENIHKDGILRETFFPAKISKKCIIQSKKIANKIAISLNVVGLIAIEMFVLDDEKIIVNEIAPRPHNSGHWTMDACNLSQFEALVRVIFKIDLPKIKYYHKCKMINILGDNYKEINKSIKKYNNIIHLYGKEVVKKNRKLGHINILY